MELIPVLEIRHGKSVHTEPKNAFVDHVVSTDPIETVKDWFDKGIRRFHFVDVDAIATGEPCNVDLLSKIKQLFPGVCIQVIGGIKDIDSAFIWIDAGADFLVLSSKAIRNKDFLSDICVEFPSKVLVEMDSRQIEQNDLNTDNVQGLDHELIKMVKLLEEEGVCGLILTEVPRQGHVSARNLLSVSQFSQNVDLPIVANGGIEKLEDLEIVLQTNNAKLSGIIVGKIVYDKSFCLASAQRMMSEYPVAC